VFVRDGNGDWSQQAYLKASNAEAYDSFGVSVAISGVTVVVGAPLEDSDGSGKGNNSAQDAGAAYVFDLTNPVPIDNVRPILRIQNKRKYRNARNRHVIRGTAQDNVAVTKLEVRSRLGKGWRNVKLQPNGRFRYRTPKLSSGNNVFSFRAIDSRGNRSKVERVRARGR